MKPIDLLEETYFALSSNKVRSGLTMLGIVIGIASVIAMVAFGQGATATIEENITSTGANLLTVTPGVQRGVGQSVSSGRGSAQTLTSSDAQAITEGTSLVSAVSPELSSRYQVTARGTNTNTSVMGATSVYLSVHNLKMEEGSFLSESDATGLSRVAVIGSNVRDDLFGEESSPIGQKIRIKNLEFTIIGITAAKGGTGFNSPDDMIYVPLTTAQKLLAGSGERVSNISVQVGSQEDMTAAQEEVTLILLDSHKISDPEAADFSVINQADIVAAASSTTDTLASLLASIAAISLLVGGIGIMNMMLTNVTERTREIGLRKAIGAHKEDISSQFLMEAVALTFIGGLVGSILGFFVSIGVEKFGGISTEVSFSSILIAFGVSAVIGILFGYYPAKRAARMNPIEALRHE